MLTVQVSFPDGEREVSAYIKKIPMVFFDRTYLREQLTPEEMDGWLFYLMPEGRWTAYENRG